MRWREKESAEGRYRTVRRILWRPIGLVYENEMSYRPKEWRWLEVCDVIEVNLGFPFGWAKFRWPGSRWS